MVCVNEWKVQLLGVPGATRGTETARLRSRETWGVLTSLALMASTGKSCHHTSFPYCTRSGLAERFWSDSLDPNHCLRQAIASIRSTFGADSILADRYIVSLRPGKFTFDIHLVRELVGKASSTENDIMRVDLLSEAEGYVRGRFLDGCILPGDSAYHWYKGCRHNVDVLVRELFSELAKSLERTGDVNGAFEAARRVLAYTDDAESLDRVWDLGRRSTPPQVADAIEAGDRFEDLMPRLARRANRGHNLTSRERRVFDAAFQLRFDMLDDKAKSLLLNVAMLPAAFSPELASSICKAPIALLNSLCEHHLLERNEKTFTFLEPVRLCALRRVKSPQVSRINKRLFAVCREHLVEIVTGNREFTTRSLLSTTNAKPILSSALDSCMSQPPSPGSLEFIDLLRSAGYYEIARRAIAWIDASWTGGPLNLEMQIQCALYLGRLYADGRQFREAIRWYLFAYERLVAVDDQEQLSRLHGVLAVAYHHSEQHELALQHNSVAYDLSSAINDSLAVAECLRFRGEIFNSIGDSQEALKALQAACTIYRDLGNLPLSLAECLYWLAEALVHLGKQTQASDTLEESLGLRIDGGDTTGIAHCIAKLGLIRCQQGRVAEGRIQILHAIMLHEQMGDLASRASAVGILGDALLQEGKVEEARARYSEGLLYWQEQEHSRWCESFQRRLRMCACSGDHVSSLCGHQ